MTIVIILCLIALLMVLYAMSLCLCAALADEASRFQQSGDGGKALPEKVQDGVTGDAHPSPPSPFHYAVNQTVTGHERPEITASTSANDNGPTLVGLQTRAGATIYPASPELAGRAPTIARSQGVEAGDLAGNPDTRIDDRTPILNTVRTEAVARLTSHPFPPHPSLRPAMGLLTVSRQIKKY